MAKNQTHIIYEGPSLIDGQPIVVLYQSGSTNGKTGNMAQTYILHANIDPITASRTGQDSAICGDCIHRGQAHSGDSGQALNRSCYVTLMHGPLIKYKGYKAGKYKYASGHADLIALGKGQVIRLGTYGDPVAVPSYIWQSLLLESKAHTAYTHGAINPMPDKIMTSADSLGQAQSAWQRGERTFRVVASLSHITKQEVLCPASDESAALRGGAKATCESCKLCAGASVKAKSVAIVVHGTSKRAALNNINQLEGV
jgi:hypothetical protein